jgi:hypothetical protein
VKAYRVFSCVQIQKKGHAPSLSEAPGAAQAHHSLVHAVVQARRYPFGDCFVCEKIIKILNIAPN